MKRRHKSEPSNKRDHVALQMALDEVLRHDPDPARRAQVKRMLEDDGWYEAASFAAFHLQTENLREPLGLRPWSPLPCTADLSKPEDIASPGGQLAMRMDSVGVSRYHPDPLAAVSSAEKRAAEATKNEIMVSAARVVPLRRNSKPSHAKDLPKPSDVA